MKRAALAAAAAVLLLELALRAIGYAAPQWYQLDRELGWQLHPHRHGWSIADGVYRIAMLGDEYSEAMAVPVQRIWWWQLPRELQRCGFQPDKLLEVLNTSASAATARRRSTCCSRPRRSATSPISSCCSSRPAT